MECLTNGKGVVFRYIEFGVTDVQDVYGLREKRLDFVGYFRRAFAT